MTDQTEIARLKLKLRDLEDLRDSGLLMQRKDGRVLQFQSGEHLRAAIRDLKGDIAAAERKPRKRTWRMTQTGTGLHR